MDQRGEEAEGGTSTLSVRDLSISFAPQGRRRVVVDRITFEVPANSAVGLVGESGCGKTVTGLAAMGLLPAAPGCSVSGELHFEGRDLLALSGHERRRLAGRRMSMVFQDAARALNPVMRVGDQIAAVLRAHRGLSRRAAREETLWHLERVALPAPKRQAQQYPHQLSGGMRQRVMIAMAIACSPTLLIADEPTTALDVGVQAQILSLLDRLRTEAGMSLLLISHDLAVIAELCDRIVVLYAGKVVETGPVSEVLAHPAHPYTAALLGALPSTGGREDDVTVGPVTRRKKLPVLPGGVGQALEGYAGCNFAARCGRVSERCRRELPPLVAATVSRTHHCFAPLTAPR